MVDRGLPSTSHLRVMIVSSSTVTGIDCLEFKVREVMEDWSASIKHTFLTMDHQIFIKKINIKKVYAKFRVPSSLHYKVYGYNNKIIL